MIFFDTVLTQSRLACIVGPFSQFVTFYLFLHFAFVQLPKAFFSPFPSLLDDLPAFYWLFVAHYIANVVGPLAHFTAQSSLFRECLSEIRRIVFKN